MQNGGLRAAVFVCADVGVPPQPRASLPARGGWTRAIASGRVGNRRYILPTPRASRGPSPGGEVRRSAAPPHFRFRIKVFPAQKTPPTGACRASPKHRARGAGEKADLRHCHNTGRRSRPRPPFRSGFARALSLWVRRIPGVPRVLGPFPERIGRMTRMQPHRENDGGCLKLNLRLAMACR